MKTTTRVERAALGAAPATAARPTTAVADERLRREQRARARREKAVTAGLAALLFVAIVIVWTLVVRLGNVKPYLLPPPEDVVSAIWADATTKTFWTEQFLTTVTEVLAGFALAVVAALVLGPLMVSHRLVERMLYPYVVAFETVPKIALAPLLIIWFGYGTQSKFIITGLVAFFPMLVNVLAGLKATDEKQLELMRSLRASWWTRLVKVRLPAALPYIFAGLNIAIVFSVIGAIVGEFLGSAHGLGSLVLQRQTAVDVAGVFSVLVFLSLLGMVLHLVLAFLSRRLAPWAQPNERT